MAKVLFDIDIRHDDGGSTCLLAKRDLDFLPTTGMDFMVGAPGWGATADFKVGNCFVDEKGEFSFSLTHSESMHFDKKDAVDLVKRLKNCGWKICECHHEPAPKAPAPQAN